MAFLQQAMDTAHSFNCIDKHRHNSKPQKNGKQLCVLMGEMLQQNNIVRFDQFKVQKVATNNEACASLSKDLLTNYVGSDRCSVLTIAFCVNDKFSEKFTLAAPFRTAQ